MPPAAEPAGIETRITRLLRMRYPVIQAGMVWTAGSRLAVAVSEAGGLGMIGAGSMKPDLLRDHIRKTRAATPLPFAVNIPLSRGDATELVRTCIEEEVRIVFTSAGHPAKHTPLLKEHGCVVVHVAATVKHAVKVRDAGCDAVVVEGFEAGGHNGMDELTTMVLVPQVADAVDIPVIAAGGIADGRGLAAALALGADGVQVGTRFAATVESSAHEEYKRAVVAARDTDTVLTLRRLGPTRMLKSPFAARAVEAERHGATPEELAVLLGEDRERLGIFSGDTAEGELEAGQSAGLVREILPAGEVVRRMVREYFEAKQVMP